MDMYATSATLQVVISHGRPILPTILYFIARRGFPAEQVTSVLADWECAPAAHAEHTTKLALHRQPLVLESQPRADA